MGSCKGGGSGRVGDGEREGEDGKEKETSGEGGFMQEVGEWLLGFDLCLTAPLTPIGEKLFGIERLEMDMIKYDEDTQRRMRIR